MDNKNERISPRCFLLMAFVFCTMMLSFACGNLIDDYIWHIKVGEDICRLGYLPGDIYSWISTQFQPLTVMWHEWLAEVIMWLFYSAGDAKGILFFAIMIVAISVAVIAINKDLIDETDSITSFIAVCMLCAGLFSMNIARPYLFGILWFALTTGFLRRYRESGNIKWLVSLPAITVLWANTHGGTILFAVLLPIGYFLCSLIHFDTARVYLPQESIRKKIAFGITALLNELAGLMSPYGFKLFLYPFTYNTSDCKKYVSEWQPSTVVNASVICVLVFLLLCIILKDRKFCLTEVGLCGVFFIMTARYVRFGFWMIITLFPLLLQINIYKNKTKFRSKDFRQKIQKYVNTFLCAIMFVFVVIVGIKLPSRPSPQTAISSSMVAMIKQMSPQRMYNSYNSGGALIYNGILDFVDARADPFSDKNIVGENIKFLRCAYIPSDMDKYMSKWNFDAYLVEDLSPVSSYLSKNKDLHLVLDDGEYSLYIVNTNV